MTDEFDGSTSGARAPDDVVANTVARRSGKVAVLRMRKVLQPKISAALRALAETGPFSLEQSVAAMQGVLREVDLNDYKGEFAQRIAAAEVHVRHGTFGKAVQLLALGQFDMFTEDLAENVLLPAGEGMHVSLARATWAHIQGKVAAQRVNVQEAVSCLALTEDAFEPHRKLMEPDPTLEFRHVMYRLGRWQRKDAA